MIFTIQHDAKRAHLEKFAGLNAKTQLHKHIENHSAASQPAFPRNVDIFSVSRRN